MERTLIQKDPVQDHGESSAKTNDLRNLDVLRAFAVLAVAGSHLDRYAVGPAHFPSFIDNFGVGGVLFFFVHTMLVLLLSMQRTRSRHLVSGFYIRRAFRIYPLCWACIILVLATGLTDVAHQKIVQMGVRGILVNLALLQNIIRYPNIEMPLWSLPWEVQMYLFLPAFYFLLKRYDRWYVPFALWLGAVSLAITFTSIDVPRAFHGTIFPPMFIGGAIAYRLLGKLRPIFPAFLWPPVLLCLMLGRCLLLRGIAIDTARNAGVNATTCFLVGLAIPLFREVRSPLLGNGAHQIAKYSYGIYLLHIPCMALVFGYAPSLPLAVKVLTIVALTALSSVTMYHLLEDPLIRVGRSIAKALG